MTKKIGFKKQLKLAWASFRTKKLLWLFFFELAMLLLTIFGVYLWTNSLKALEPTIAKIEAGTLSDDLVLTAQSLVYKMMIYTAILMLFLFLNYSFFKGYIYNRLVGSKYTLKYLFKSIGFVFFLGLFTLIIAIIFGGIALLLVNLGSVIITIYTVFLLLLIFFLMYLTVLWYINFAATHKIWKGFKLMIQNGIFGIKKFLLPLLIILLIFFALNLVLLPFSFLPNTIYLTLTLIFFLFYLTWMNIYIYNIQKDQFHNK